MMESSSSPEGDFSPDALEFERQDNTGQFSINKIRADLRIDKSSSTGQRTTTQESAHVSHDSVLPSVEANPEIDAITVPDSAPQEPAHVKHYFESNVIGSKRTPEAWNTARSQIRAILDRAKLK